MKSLRRVTHSTLLSSVFTTLDVMIILSGTDAASRPKAGGTSTLVTQASAVIAPSKKQICLSPRLPIDQHDETIRPDIAAAKRNWSAPRERSVRSGSSSSFAPAPSLSGTAATGVEALFVPIASACGDLCLPNILATFSSTAFMLPSRAIPHPVWPKNSHCKTSWAVYATQRGLAARCPLRCWGDQWWPLRTAGQNGGAHGVGTHPGLHQRDGGPGAAAAE